MKRKKTGRPKVPSRTASRVVIYVREDQRAQLEGAANNLEVPVSSYVREMLCMAQVIAR